jgi:hypothetical protein
MLNVYSKTIISLGDPDDNCETGCKVQSRAFQLLAFHKLDIFTGQFTVRVWMRVGMTVQ